jgi:hypothetical protein
LSKTNHKARRGQSHLVRVLLIDAVLEIVPGDLVVAKPVGRDLDEVLERRLCHQWGFQGEFERVPTRINIFHRPGRNDGKDDLAKCSPIILMNIALGQGVET